MGWTAAIILFSTLLLICDSVSIYELSSSTIAEVGKEFILDCNFNYTEDERDQIVVKWFFNKSKTPFYQWVPSLDIGPQVISDKFSDLIDLSYSLDGEDKYSEFRALRIPSMKLDLAGFYKCQVSSFTAETAMGKLISVFASPSSMKLTSSSSATSESVTISCTVQGVFPAPLLNLSWTQHLEAHTTITPATVTEEEEGLFSAYLTVSIPRESAGEEDVVSCQLSIPGTDFQITEETEMFEEQIPEQFLEMFNKQNAADAVDETDKDYFIVASDYEQEIEEPAVALERSFLPLEQTLPYSDAVRKWPSMGNIILGLILLQLHLR